MSDFETMLKAALKQFEDVEATKNIYEKKLVEVTNDYEARCGSCRKTIVDKESARKAWQESHELLKKEIGLLKKENDELRAYIGANDTTKEDYLKSSDALNVCLSAKVEFLENESQEAIKRIHYLEDLHDSKQAKLQVLDTRNKYLEHVLQEAKDAKYETENLLKEYRYAYRLVTEGTRGED